MEDQSLKRKERLLALKAKSKRTNDVEETSLLRFRNYEPLNDDLKQNLVDVMPIGPHARDSVPTVEGNMENFAKNALLEEKNRSKEVV